MSDKSKKDDSFYRPESKWFGRSLENYKSMHAKLAQDKGVEREFQESRTLTQARKILFGYKKGQNK